MDLFNKCNSDKGIFLERNANNIESVKLTIKLIKPINPIPIMDQKNDQKAIEK